MKVTKILKFCMFCIFKKPLSVYIYIWEICQNKLVANPMIRDQVVKYHNNVLSMNNDIVVVKMIHLIYNLKHDNLNLANL